MADLIFNVAGFIILVSIILAAIRMILGPTTVDRVIALDVLTVVTVILIALLTVILDRQIYFDVALVYALITFVGVIAIARHIEGGM